MNNPLISIVMPVYNAKPYLKQAIQSVFAQTIADWELIAIDDCSTDGSWEYLQTINDTKIRLIRNSQNRGHSYTCNKAFALAKGQYIAKMDADDISFPERIKLQLQELQSRPDVDVLGCGVIKVSKELDYIGVNIPPVDHDRITDIASLNKKIINGANFSITNGALMGKREWFLKWQYNTHIYYAQDFDLMCRAQKESVFGNIPELLYIYRRSGVTASWKKQSFAIYVKIKSILKYGFKNGYRLKSTLGLIALIPRPIFAIIIDIILKNNLFQSTLRKAGPYTEKILSECINKVEQTIIPVE